MSQVVGGRLDPQMEFDFGNNADEIRAHNLHRHNISSHALLWFSAEETYEYFLCQNSCDVFEILSMPLVHIVELVTDIRHSSPQRMGPSLYSQLCGSPAQLTDRPAAKLVLTMYMSGEPQNTYLSTISCHLLFLHYI